MSTFSSSIPNDWVLVQWDSGDYNLVYERAVLTPLDNLEIGDETFVTWHGVTRKAIYIARAESEDTQAATMPQGQVARQQEAGPSRRSYDWHDDDHSPSSSDSWQPKNDTTEDEEEDSDKDIRRRVKLGRCKRQINVNSTNRRKKATPSLRVTPVLPKTMPRKSTNINNVQNNKSETDKELTEQLNGILTDLQTALKMLEPKTPTGKIIIPTKYKTQNQSVDEVRENEAANSRHEASSTSDNVLITNQYKVVRGYTASYLLESSVSTLPGPSGINSSGPSVINPSGSWASKKYKDEKDVSVEEDATENEAANSRHLASSSSANNVLKSNNYKLVKRSSASYLSSSSGSSVSNPSGTTSASKKYKAENKDRTRYYQSVQEGVSEEILPLILKDARTREVMRKVLEDNLKLSVSNRSGPSTSKKNEAENTNRSRYNQSDEDVSEDEADVPLKLLRDAKTREATTKKFEGNLRPSPCSSGSTAAKKYKKSGNKDQTRYDQSVKDFLEVQEDVALKLRDARAREAMKKMLEGNLTPSASNTSERLVSNPSRPSVSNLLQPSVSNPSRPSVSNQSDLSEWNPPGSSTSKKYKAKNTRQTRYKEDVSEDEEDSENDEFNRSDDNVLITNKHRKVTVKTIRKPDEWVPIGSGTTQVHRDKYLTINWKSYTIATRTLLLALFPRRVLATHSLTGKKSPAFQDKPAKMCLDPKIISDVIHEIKKRFKVKESLIRSIITTKCADECKMYKTRVSRNSENMSPGTYEEDDE